LNKFHEAILTTTIKETTTIKNQHLRVETYLLLRRLKCNAIREAMNNNNKRNNKKKNNKRNNKKNNKSNN
jgi:hypothetical protein